MKAFVVDAPGRASVRDVPVPAAGPGELLVQVEAVGICKTDVAIYRGESLNRLPLIPGHEFCGTVAEKGPDVSGFAPGDRIVVDPVLTCGVCARCLAGMANHCLRWEGLGSTRNGAFAEYVSVPARQAHPWSGSPRTGAFAEPLSCVLYGLEHVRPRLEDRVLILGAGPIGQLHLRVLKSRGVERIAVTDQREDRLAAAVRGGAGVVVPAGPGSSAELLSSSPDGFDLVIDTTGVPDVVDRSIDFATCGARVLLFGVSPEGSVAKVKPYDIFFKDLSIMGSFVYKPHHFPDALRLLREARIQVEDLVAETVSLEDLPGSLTRLAKGEAAMKIHVTR